MVALAVTGLLLPVAGAGSAAADTAPTTADPVTVSADALPTVQINGVVWSQVVVGTTVYATGSFTTARPAGSASGVNETARSNVLAYNIETGELLESWAPSLNAQGRVITASADGKVIYVGGDFTRVSGVNRYRIVALDASTGAVVTAFAASANARVTALAVNGSTVYAGGAFTVADSVTRTRLAAFSAATGALTAWAPAADARVQAMTVLPSVNKVVIGGQFLKVNGSSQPAIAAVDATTGATLSWPVNTVIRNGGNNSGIDSVTTDGTSVYIAGWAWSSGNFESAARLDLNGNITWVSGCRGDTYSVYPLASVLYTVSHAHDCQAIPGGFVQPGGAKWWQRALALSLEPAGTNVPNAFGSPFTGKPAPRMLHWFPTLTAGSYTGQTQAAWSITGNASYIVLGGEFPKVNGKIQQGLVRMAVRDLAPNKQGPRPIGAVTATSPSAGTVRVSWTSTWDRDNALIGYDVLRGKTVVGHLSSSNGEHNRTAMSFTDTAVPAGTQSYTLRAADAYNNRATSVPVTVTVG